MGSESGVGGIGRSEERAGGRGERGVQRRGVEAGAEGEQGAENRSAGRSSGERLGEGVADGGLSKVGGESADFLVAERSRKFGGEARESDGGVFASEGKGREDAVFKRERAPFG